MRSPELLEGWVMRISAAEFAKRFGELSDEALAQPLIITRHGRDRLVVMSLAKYRELTEPGGAKQSERANNGRPRSAKPAGSKPSAMNRPVPRTR
jgi:prevent-host-death family protein